MKKLISILLTITMMLSTGICLVSADIQSFSDLPREHWAYNDVAALTERGVINGYDDGSFQPDKVVTRAEWAKMFVIAGGINTEGLFVHLLLESSDISEKHWASLYLVAANNYFEPYHTNEGPEYRPEQGATREEAAVSLAKLKGYYSEDTSVLNTFGDKNKISDNAKAYIAAAVENGLISGFDDNTFRPDKTVTRAEAAVMLSRAFAGTGNTEEIKTLHKPFADKMYLDENGCGELWYDLDFDGNDDCIEMRQSRSFANSPDGDLNCLKTELVVNGQALLLDNAYKTHGCGGVFVADTDQSDDYLDIIVLMSYKHINAYVYQYRNGELIPSYCINKDTNLKSDFFNVGGWGEAAKVDLETAGVSVNDMEWQVPGFTVLISGNEYYYEKTAQDEYRAY